MAKEVSKFSKSLVSVGSFIQKNKMPMLYLGGALAIVYIGLPILNKLRKTIQQDSDEFAKKGGTDSDFKPFLVDRSKTTISDDLASRYAEQLFESFSVTGGTDESSIKDVFDKINTEDFKLIYNKFKNRSYSWFNQGSPTTNVLAPDTYLGYDNYDLLGWFRQELGVFDFITKSKINKVIKPLGLEV